MGDNDVNYLKENQITTNIEPAILPIAEHEIGCALLLPVEVFPLWLVYSGRATKQDIGRKSSEKNFL